MQTAEKLRPVYINPDVFLDILYINGVSLCVQKHVG